MTEKQQIQAAISELPDDCSFEDAQQKLYVLRKIQRGLAQLDRGEAVPHEDVKKLVESWKQA
jgi:predicted transcriptional regulator